MTISMINISIANVSAILACELKEHIALTDRGWQLPAHEIFLALQSPVSCTDCNTKWVASFRHRSTWFCVYSTFQLCIEGRCYQQPSYDCLRSRDWTSGVHRGYILRILLYLSVILFTGQNTRL